jgi:hypothetical protein
MDREQTRGSRLKRQVTPAHDQVRATKGPYAIPRAHAAEALERVRALIVDRQFPVLFPIGLRFTAPDDAFLSTAHGRDTAYLAVHQVVRAEYEPLLPRHRGDHGRVREPPALGQAPLPDRRHATTWCTVTIGALSGHEVGRAAWVLL